jgi:hypothetical protein
VTGLSCHHRPRRLPANLTPASGRQDHTTSPSAPVSTKAARRSWYRSRRSFSEGGSASLVLRRRRVHRIPHPTSVTIAIRPSYRGRDARKMMLIWGEINGVGLRQIGTTGKSPALPLRTLRSAMSKPSKDMASKVRASKAMASKARASKAIV